MGVVICAGCGKAVKNAWKPCPNCGANPRTGKGATPAPTGGVRVAAAKKSSEAGAWGLGLIVYGAVFSWMPIYILAASAFAALVVGGIFCLYPFYAKKSPSKKAVAGLLVLGGWFVLVFVVYVF